MIYKDVHVYRTSSSLETCDEGIDFCWLFIGVGGLPPRYIKLSAILAKENLSVIDCHVGFLIGVGGVPPQVHKVVSYLSKGEFNCD